MSLCIFPMSCACGSGGVAYPMAWHQQVYGTAPAACAVLELT